MKQLKLLVCAMALASIAIFTGCGSDDDNNNGGGGNPPPTGTNAPASLSSSRTVFNDGTGDNTVDIAADNTYTATFSDGKTETGTATYSASGDTGTLVLTPSDGSANSNITMTFDSSASAGAYTSDTIGAGNFTTTSTAATP